VDHADGRKGVRDFGPTTRFRLVITDRRRAETGDVDGAFNTLLHGRRVGGRRGTRGHGQHLGGGFQRPSRSSSSSSGDETSRNIPNSVLYGRPDVRLRPGSGSPPAGAICLTRHFSRRAGFIRVPPTPSAYGGRFTPAARSEAKANAQKPDVNRPPRGTRPGQAQRGRTWRSGGQSPSSFRAGDRSGPNLQRKRGSGRRLAWWGDDRRWRFERLPPDHLRRRSTRRRRVLLRPTAAQFRVGDERDRDVPLRWVTGGRATAAQIRPERVEPSSAVALKRSRRAARADQMVGLHCWKRGPN